MNNKDHMDNASKHAPSHGKDEACKTKPETQHTADSHKAAGEHKDTHGTHKGTK